MFVHMFTHMFTHMYKIKEARICNLSLTYLF